MGYPIIFKTKIVNLSDGRILHLNRSGCNNDTEGRRNDEWNGKIYTKEEFAEMVDHFMDDSKPMKESENFDLKIGSRYCTFYDYAQHMLRMQKRATSFDELISSKEPTTFKRYDGVVVYINDEPVKMTMYEFKEYVQTHLFQNCHYRYEWTPLLTEKDVVNALDKNEPLKIRIGY